MSDSRKRKRVDAPDSFDEDARPAKRRRLQTDAVVHELPPVLPSTAEGDDTSSPVDPFVDEEIEEGSPELFTRSVDQYHTPHPNRLNEEVAAELSRTAPLTLPSRSLPDTTVAPPSASTASPLLLPRSMFPLFSEGDAPVSIPLNRPPRRTESMAIRRRRRSSAAYRQRRLSQRISKSFDPRVPNSTPVSGFKLFLFLLVITLGSLVVAYTLGTVLRQFKMEDSRTIRQLVVEQENALKDLKKQNETIGKLASELSKLERTIDEETSHSITERDDSEEVSLAFDDVMSKYNELKSLYVEIKSKVDAESKEEGKGEDDDDDPLGLYKQIIDQNVHIQKMQEVFAKSISDFTEKIGGVKDKVDSSVDLEKMKDVMLKLLTEDNETKMAIDQLTKRQVAVKTEEDMDVYGIVQREIARWQNDMINRTDYAQQSMGGEIIDYSSVFESYQSLLMRYFPLFRLKKFLNKRPVNPAGVITPGFSLGACFPLKGSRGHIMIQLPVPVIPDGFSIDHAPLALTPNPETAPKRFRVYGYYLPRADPELLLEAEYDYTSMVQTWDVQGVKTGYTKYRLEILSNHGSDEFTCLYRFRVHGTRVLMHQLTDGK